ncbi:M15 family metallopeptidase [Terricaulis sp.]|uniref:M15 family metallopeptidase n=1 Tax=Terricaulis sp. TaxID=2768686 RepID=UPI00378315A4
MRFVLFVVALLASAASASAQDERPRAFVDASTVVPGLVVDMRYAGSNNFVGRPIAGYEAPVCWLTRQAAARLAEAQAELRPFGLGLKVFDCYRPTRAVADFAAWARDLNDTARRAEYYPNVDKSQLFALGYIAERSGHSRGSTVDLTVIDLATGAEIDMGSPFDLFDTRSWPTDATVGSQQRTNRLMLQSVMRAHGFRPLQQEWWHFMLEREPYPNQYFDFPVTR